MKNMTLEVPRWMMRLLVASATTMVVVGWFGLRSLGVKADWLAFYAAGSFTLQGELSQIYDAAVIQAWEEPLIGANIIRFLYAPAYATTFVPLAFMPVQAARYSWLVVGVLASLLASRLSTRWSGLSTPLSALALLAFPPLAYTLAVGQISPITLLIFSFVASQEWQEKHGYLPGMVAGLALFKPQLLIPIIFYWLFQRRWRSLIGFMFTASLISLVSWLVSPQATLAYIQLSTQFMHLAENATTTGANASFYSVHPWLGFLVSAGIIATLFFTSGRGNNRYKQALLWIAPVLVTPYIVIYDMLLLALPISFLLLLLSRDRLMQAAVGLIWFTPLFAIAIQTTHPVTWSAFVLFVVCAWRFFKTPAGQISHSDEFIEHPASS